VCTMAHTLPSTAAVTRFTSPRTTRVNPYHLANGVRDSGPEACALAPGAELPSAVASDSGPLTTTASRAGMTSRYSSPSSCFWSMQPGSKHAPSRVIVRIRVVNERCDIPAVVTRPAPARNTRRFGGSEAYGHEPAFSPANSQPRPTAHPHQRIAAQLLLPQLRVAAILPHGFRCLLVQS